MSSVPTAQGKQAYGLLAEFETVDQVLAAAEAVRDAGYRKWDVHSPMPIHGMDEAMGIRPSRLPWVVLLAGLGGGGGALLLQWWTNAVDYPLIISGKPLFSLPANIPVTFELTVLCAAVTAFLGLMVGNRLPQWYHPVFTCARFARATTDRFYVVIDASDAAFDWDATRSLLTSLDAVSVDVVEGT